MNKRLLSCDLLPGSGLQISDKLYDTASSSNFQLLFQVHRIFTAQESQNVCKSSILQEDGDNQFTSPTTSKKEKE